LIEQPPEDNGPEQSEPTAAEETGRANLKKDPSEWATADEPMTAAQTSYLKSLADKAGESFDPNMTKAEASKRIDELQEKTRRR
jgi:hypothetical protein